ncbi:cytochrome c [Sulfitobacter sp. HGT1]|uniref:c-type cytochrome n=1 Tax=Sulfitobacter sp. HGT1 TaxID=2735435 RepID=UPI0015947395|nr:cytochrome c [Sulfitobacter sp. HGT1]
MRIKIAVITAAVATLGGLWLLWPTVSEPVTETTPGGPMVTVTLPASLSTREKMGETAFNASCADCHGTNGAGRDGIAPPLIHKIYEPGHHGDISFERAALYGVKSHHWTFGDMAPVKGLTAADIGTIVAYVRAVQRANGIN